MAEGGFDEYEMDNLGDDYQKYNDKQLENARVAMDDRRENLDELLKGGGESDSVRVEYDNVIRHVLRIESEINRRQAAAMAEYSFTDDGGVVDIEGPSGKIVEVPEVEFVDDIPTVDDIIPPSKRKRVNPKVSVTSGRKRTISEFAGFDIRKKYGKASSDLLEGSKIRYSDDHKRLGIQYDGKNVVVLGGDRKTLVYSRDTTKSTQTAVKAFKDAVSKSKLEHDNFGKAEKEMPMVDTERERGNVPGLTDIENRELGGVLNPTGTTEGRTGDNGALQTQADHFNEAINETHDMLDNTRDPIVQEELRKRVDGLKEAMERTIEQRTKEEVRGQQEEDIGRLQRFKEWLKENWLGASALGITIASFITTIIVAARSAIVKGGGALGKLGKAIANLAGKAGPLLAGLLNVVAAALKWGAAGVAWLASNLWVLVLAFLWFVYDQYKSRK